MSKFEATAGYCIGSVMIFQEWNDQFSKDRAVYDQLYEEGFRAFQLFLIGHEDDYLRDLRKWADDKGDVELSGLLAFIETGTEGACPINPYVTKRQNARDLLDLTIGKAKLIGATGVHGPLFQGLMNEHLDDVSHATQRDYLIDSIRHVATQA
ncbi:MAG: hypothetical protein IID54_07970, partial [Proteobacteria bacterium]|nr:hypothetical protein [Pseudomonadota bacterium]